MARNHNTPCPELADLVAFANGNLADTKLDHLATHILSCDACGIAVDNVSKKDDSELVTELRAMKAQSSDLCSTNGRNPCFVPKELWQAACLAIDHSSLPASFDSGKRLANKLKNGPVRLGRFELLTELGVGAFGYVFKAHDTLLNRFVALKVQRAGTFATTEEVERFVREAQSIARLKHRGS